MARPRPGEADPEPSDSDCVVLPVLERPDQAVAGRPWNLLIWGRNVSRSPSPGGSSRAARIPQMWYTRRVQTTETQGVSRAADESTVTGVIKWFSPKGFGFIARPAGEDVYVHHSAVTGNGRDTLTQGTRVRFVVIDSERGPEAIDVSPVD